MTAPAALPLAPAPRRLVTAALLLGTVLASLEVAVVGPAMPQVVGELSAAGLYPWVFTVYVVAQTAAIPVYGALSDRIGRRPAYLLSVGLFLLGSVLCAVAGSMPTVVFGRAVQGLGAGGLVPLTVTIFGDLYAPEERTRLQGIFSLAWGLSSVGSPLLGGFLTEAFSWRSIFWMNLPPGLLTGALVALLLPPGLGRGQVRPGQQGALQLLRNPTQQAVLGSGLVLGGVLLGVVSYVSLYVQAVQGGDALDAGLALIPMSVAWTLAANLAGLLLGRLGFRGLTRLGTACIAVGALMGAFWPVHQAGLILLGVGFGFTISTWNVAVQEAAPRHLKGTATSWSLFVRSMGGAVAVPALAALAGIDPGARTFAGIVGLEEGLGLAFGAIGLAGVGSAVVAWGRFPRGVVERGAE